MPASYGTHKQPPTSTNLKWYNAAQPDISCIATLDMSASQYAPASRPTYTTSLQQRREHSKIIMLYRIRHKLANIPTATYIRPSTRNTQHYILPYARTLVFQTSFFPSSPSTIKIWNNLGPTTCHNQQHIHSTT